MPITKVKLTKIDIETLKNRKERNSKMRISILAFFLFLLLVSYLILDNEFYKFLKIIVIVITSFFLLGSLLDANYDYDLKQKEKYVGFVKVKEKKYWRDSEDDTEYHTINFDDWRIGNKHFHKKTWNEINKGDEFYVEQGCTSGYTLILRKDDIDFIDKIIR